MLECCVAQLALRPCCLAPPQQNVVATVNLECKLDLKNIALHARNAEYNPKRFAAVIMRIREPKSTALIFHSGAPAPAGPPKELPFPQRKALTEAAEPAVLSPLPVAWQPGGACLPTSLSRSMRPRAPAAPRSRRPAADLLLICCQLTADTTCRQLAPAGKMVCTGTKSEAEARIASRKYAKILQKLGYAVSFKVRRPRPGVATLLFRDWFAIVSGAAGGRESGR